MRNLAYTKIMNVAYMIFSLAVLMWIFMKIDYYYISKNVSYETARKVLSKMSKHKKIKKVLYENI